MTAKMQLQCKIQESNEMFMADMFSRAFLPEVHACEFPHKLEVTHTSRSFAED